MTAPIMISRNALCLVLVLSPLALGISNAAGANVQVYKCTQPNGTALYTDRACKGGTEVDIRLGPVDPTAPARLARAQAELDAAAAQHRAEEAIAATRGEELNRLQLEAEAAAQGPTGRTTPTRTMALGATDRPGGMRAAAVRRLPCTRTLDPTKGVFPLLLEVRAAGWTLDERCLAVA